MQTGVPRSKQTVPLLDSRVGLCLGPCSGLIGEELFLMSEVPLVLVQMKPGGMLQGVHMGNSCTGVSRSSEAAPPEDPTVALYA